MTDSESKVRIRTTDAIPEVTLNLLVYYTQASVNHCIINIPAISPTVNHMYKHTRFGTRLTEEAKAFREIVSISMGPLRNTWKPMNPVSAVILFESPSWLTKKRTVRKLDCDNRVKPLFDAIEIASGMRDELCWQFHAFKIPSKKERTTVYLFELSDIVEYMVEGG